MNTQTQIVEVVVEPVKVDVKEIPKGIEYARSLRLIADFIEQNPDIPLPGETIQVSSVSGKDQILQVARALKSFEKKYDEQFFHMEKKFGVITLDYYEYRHTVCKRVSKGQQVVKKQIPRTYTEVETIEEKFEWECPQEALLKNDEIKQLENL